MQNATCYRRCGNLLIFLSLAKVDPSWQTEILQEQYQQVATTAVMASTTHEKGSSLITIMNFFVMRVSFIGTHPCFLLFPTFVNTLEIIIYLKKKRNFHHMCTDLQLCFLSLHVPSHVFGIASFARFIAIPIWLHANNIEVYLIIFLNGNNFISLMNRAAEFNHGRLWAQSEFVV